jgi:diguanylate cyclase (GGDEF)-like protein
MKPKTSKSLILLAVGATFAAIFLYPYLPLKRHSLLAESAHESLIADLGEGSGNAITWIDRDKRQYRCSMRSNKRMMFCAYDLVPRETPGVGIDLSSYDRIVLKMDYVGTTKRLKFYLRQYDPRYSTLKDDNSPKFMSAAILVQELEKEVTILFDEFRVTDWWLNRYSLPRQLAKPEFDNITALGIDFAANIPAGDHVFTIEKIDAVGPWIAERTWHLGILVLWMTAIAALVAEQWLSLRHSKTVNRRRIDELASKNLSLQTESEQYRQLSSLDALTGVFNRRGIEQAIGELTSENDDNAVAFILLDIDHFKQLNDDYGHDVGDEVLKQVTDLLIRNTRNNDRVGRWGGEEFIILCPQTDLDNGFMLAEKIRATIATNSFLVNDHSINITASFGVTTFRESADFAEAFKRVDRALYRAKHQGRDRSVKAE